MSAPTQPPAEPRPAGRFQSLTRDRGAIAWMGVVAAVYLIATLLIARSHPTGIDRAMHLAVNLSQGRLDLGPTDSPRDTVTVDGRSYQVISPLPVAPYLLFVPFPRFYEESRWLISVGLGILAGWLSLPLARRYGPAGPVAYWLAVMATFGTLLFSMSVRGNFYYLGHVEAVLFTFVALLEWGGRRRPAVVGLALGLAGLARPTVLLAAIPFGVVLVWQSRDRLRALIGYVIPLGITVAVAGLYNYLRFGSALESGYGISVLTNAELAQRRSGGLFALRNLPDNLGVLVARGFDVRAAFPWLVPDTGGHSLLLTSPALLAAVGAGVRDQLTRPLWAAAILVAIPVLLYYGGGGAVTYGYRYALDFIPFLVVLVAIAARTRFGALEKALIVLSVLFVSYGIVWTLFGG